MSTTPFDLRLSVPHLLTGEARAFLKEELRHMCSSVIVDDIAWAKVYEASPRETLLVHSTGIPELVLN